MSSNGDLSLAAGRAVRAPKPSQPKRKPKAKAKRQESEPEREVEESAEPTVKRPRKKRGQ